MSRCTWIDCAADAAHPQVGAGGQQWANLCDEHAAAFHAAFKAGVPQMVSAWVKAQGGAKAAARRMRPEEPK